MQNAPCTHFVDYLNKQLLVRIVREVCSSICELIGALGQFYFTQMLDQLGLKHFRSEEIHHQDGGDDKHNVGYSRGLGYEVYDCVNCPLANNLFIR
jgi:hypothetical protein